MLPSLSLLKCGDTWTKTVWSWAFLGRGPTVGRALIVVVDSSSSALHQHLPMSKKNNPGTDLRSPVPWGFVLFASVLALLEPVVRLGCVHPDETFQAIEPAFERAFGRGFLAWEWKVGLRNEVVVSLLAQIFRSAHSIGVRDPQIMRIFIHFPLFLLTIAVLRAVYLMTARRLAWRDASEGTRDVEWAKYSVLALGVWPIFVFFQTRHLSETWSTSFLILGFDAVDPLRTGEPGVSPLRLRRYLLAGLYFGLAEVTRYTTAVLLGPAFLGMLLGVGTRGLAEISFRGRGARTGAAAIGFLVPVAVLGVVDARTWGVRIPGLWAGGAFHSLISYVDVNFVRGVASSWFGTNPWYYYLPRLHIVAPLLGVWQAILWVKNQKQKQPSNARASVFGASMRYHLPLICSAVYMLVLLKTPHKEARFLYPSLVLITVVMLPETIVFIRNIPQRSFGFGAKLLLAAGAVFWAIPAFLPGPYTPEHRDTFRFLLHAGREGRGALILGTPIEATGGYSMLGADLPLCASSVKIEENCVESAIKDRRVSAVYLFDRVHDRFEKRLSCAGFREDGREDEGGIWHRVPSVEPFMHRDCK